MENINSNELKDYNEIYKKILKDNGDVTEDEIKYMNTLTSVIKLKSTLMLDKIVRLYSRDFPEESLNWVDVSGIKNMSYLFFKSRYNGDISCD